MVRKLGDGTCALNVYSVQNEWMDCIVVTDDCVGEETEMVLEEAWDSYWSDEDAQDVPYGDWLKESLRNAGIACEIYFKSIREE